VYEDTLAAIGNLDYLFSFSGMPMPHAIWLRLQPAAQGADVVKAMRDMGVEPAQIGDTGALIAEEKAKTERVGIFGTLSVGFLAAALMALAGLLINTYASFNRRQYEFTVLRALGLYRGQALGQVLLEYLFLTAYGAAAGAAVGMAAAILFSPFFRVTGMREAPLPPLLPIIAQDRIMGIAVAMAAIMIVLEMIVIAAAISGRMFRSLALRSQA
jgi:putative ABC transport system permease protein